jgi:hypothetical protein
MQARRLVLTLTLTGRNAQAGLRCRRHTQRVDTPSVGDVRLRAEQLVGRIRGLAANDSAAGRGRELAAAIDQVAQSYEAISRGGDDVRTAAALWVYSTVIEAAIAEWDTLFQDRRAAELTTVLAAADVLPAGVQARNVGRYEALRFRPYRRGAFWATTDLVDGRGTGHLEIVVGRIEPHMPPTATELQEHGGTSTERSLPDGSVVTTWSERNDSSGTINLQVIHARPGGDYVHINANNTDTHTGQPAREQPVLDLDAMTRIAAIPGLRP